MQYEAYRNKKMVAKLGMLKYAFSVLFTLISITLVAQNGNLKRYSVQLDYGISKTLHYNQPVNFYLCFEGCIAEEQASKTASNIGLSIYRAFDSSNSLKIGGGLAAYRFVEEGLTSYGGFNLYPYQNNREFRYYNISTGFRHHFNTRKKIVRPFIETAFIYEKLKEKSYRAENLKKNGFAVNLHGGMDIRVANNFSILVGGFYKTGIVNYGNLDIDDIPDFNTKYIPFSFGFQAGIRLLLDKI